jgi:uncharacterized protein (DUF924 family)
MSIDTRAEDVLAWWFGPPATGADALRPLWFVKSEATDREIHTRYAPLVEEALQGRLDGWMAERDSALARILVLDQFTRNIFRDTPRAFAGDAQALAAARALIDAGWDRQLPPARRAFVYMPLEHAEDLSAQDEAVSRFSALAAEAPEMAGMLDWARKHREVVLRFGRFPHRNEILGRASTDEESAFLNQPGSRF